MDPREVVSEVLGDVAEAEQRLRRAEAKMADSGLSEREGYREIAEFIGAALRNVRVTSDASTRRLKGPSIPPTSSSVPAPTPPAALEPLAPAAPPAPSLPPRVLSQPLPAFAPRARVAYST